MLIALGIVFINKIKAACEVYFLFMFFLLNWAFRIFILSIIINRRRFFLPRKYLKSDNFLLHTKYKL